MKLALFVVICLLLHITQIWAPGHKQRLKNSADDIVESDETSKQRGGHKQRKIHAPDAAPENTQGSSSSDLPFTQALIKDWANGAISSKKLQQYALSAMEQGAHGLHGMAKMGNYGQNPQNIFRAMRSLLGLPAGAPELSWYEIPTKKSKNTIHPFLCPHSFISAFYSGRSNREWIKHITGPAGACTEFWESIRQSAFVSEHPNLPENEWKHTIPIGMHADAGAFSKQDSIYVFSFNSLIGRGSTHQKRFIFTVIKKSDMLPNTMDEILRVFAWSCNALLSGVTPSQNPFGKAVAGGGQALAGPWRGALCQVRGDWAFYKECFNFMGFLQGVLPFTIAGLMGFLQGVLQFSPVERCGVDVFLLSGIVHYSAPLLDRLFDICWVARHYLEPRCLHGPPAR